MIFLCVSKCANHDPVISLEGNFFESIILNGVAAGHLSCTTSHWILLHAEVLGDIEAALDAEHQRILESA